MQKLFSEALKVRNLFGIAIFSLIIVYLFKDTIQKFADNESILGLFLGFLLLMIICVIGLTAYYAISEKEIEGDTRRPVARVKRSEDVTGKQTGTDGIIEIDDSKGVNITQEGSSSVPPEKKT